MRDNTLTVDDATKPAKITFAPTFNVAVPFIDRHVEAQPGFRLHHRLK